MPPRPSCTVSRAEQFGVQADGKAIAHLGGEASVGIQQLTCSFRGVATARGGVDITSRIVRDSILVYEWRALGEMVDERHEAKVRANHASGQGVPFPVALARVLRAEPAREKLRMVARQIARRISYECKLDCDVASIKVGAPAGGGAGHRGGEAVFEFRHFYVDPERTQRYKVEARIDHIAARGLPHCPLEAAAEGRAILGDCALDKVYEFLDFVNMFKDVLSQKVKDRARALQKKYDAVWRADAKRGKERRREQAAMEMQEFDSLLASLALPFGVAQVCRALMFLGPMCFDSPARLRVIMDAASPHEVNSTLKVHIADNIQAAQRKFWPALSGYKVRGRNEADDTHLFRLCCLVRLETGEARRHAIGEICAFVERVTIKRDDVKSHPYARDFEEVFGAVLKHGPLDQCHVESRLDMFSFGGFNSELRAKVDATFGKWAFKYGRIRSSKPQPVFAEAFSRCTHSMFAEEGPSGFWEECYKGLGTLRAARDRHLRRQQPDDANSGACSPDGSNSSLSTVVPCAPTSPDGPAFWAGCLADSSSDNDYRPVGSVRTSNDADGWRSVRSGTKRRRLSTKLIPTHAIVKLHETLADDPDTRTPSGLRNVVDGMTVNAAEALGVYGTDIDSMSNAQVRALHEQLVTKLYNIRVFRAKKCSDNHGGGSAGHSPRACAPQAPKRKLAVDGPNALLGRVQLASDGTAPGAGRAVWDSDDEAMYKAIASEMERDGRDMDDMQESDAEPSSELCVKGA